MQVDEFLLIDAIVAELGEQSRASWLAVGPGDDAAVLTPSAGTQAVASIDTLLADVHFPSNAPFDLIGYRAVMVSASDLAAMAANARYALVSLTIDNPSVDQVRALARGMAAAASECGLAICGGNLTRGPMSIAVSVHGEVPNGQALTRSGARVGDVLQVSGPIGGAGLCVATREFEVNGGLTASQEKYFRPKARLDLVDVIRRANAGIDVSDGFLADLAHLMKASGCGCEIDSSALPLFPGASLEHSLVCGDDYELLVTAPDLLPGFTEVGSVVAGEQILLDGKPIEPEGFNHFGA